VKHIVDDAQKAAQVTIVSVSILLIVIALVAAVTAVHNMHMLSTVHKSLSAALLTIAAVS